MKERNKDPKIAPGMNDQDELEQNATRDEVQKGKFTPVIKLSYDEVDPS